MTSGCQNKNGVNKFKKIIEGLMTSANSKVMDETYILLYFVSY